MEQICQNELTNHTHVTAPVHTASVLVLLLKQAALWLNAAESKAAHNLLFNNKQADVKYSHSFESIFYWPNFNRFAIFPIRPPNCDILNTIC